MSTRLPTVPSSRRGAAAVLIAAAFVAGAHAHALHLLRGAAELRDDRLTITIEMPDASLRHLAERAGPGSASPADTLDASAARIATGLVLRDETGRLIPGRPPGTRLGPAGGEIVLTYDLAGDCDRFVLRYVPHLDPGLREQIALHCTAGGPTTAVLRLTSGGNPEYLLRTRDGPARDLRRDLSALRTCAAYAADQPARCQQIVLDVAGDEIRVSLPLHLLDGWTWLPHADPDYVRLDEFAAARATLERELGRRLAPADDSGLTVAELELVGPRTGERVSVWTGRVHARLTGSATIVRCGLFHGRVQQVAAVRNDGDDCRVQTLTSYAPEIRR